MDPKTDHADAPVEERPVKAVIDRSQMGDLAKATGTAMALARATDDALVILKHGLDGTRQQLRYDAEQAVRALMAHDRTYALRLRKMAQDAGITGSPVPEQPPVTPEIVMLAGSRKLLKEILEIAHAFTVEGKIVFAPIVATERDAKAHNTKVRAIDESEALRKSKLEISDSLYVVNPKGEIDAATAREIVYAKMLKRPVLSLEPLDFEQVTKLVNDAA